MSRPDRSRVLLAATANAGKVAEIRPLLEPALRSLHLTLRCLAPGKVDLAEDRATFTGNAAVKALGAARRLGLVSLGEDSGLEVEALGGRPGVRSARFSGGGAEGDNRLLLELLASVPAGRRGARFRTVAVLKAPGGPAYAAEGTADGEILTEPRGERGFGYDPLFFSLDLGCSFAEASLAEKGRVSHRSRALRALRGYLFEAFPRVGRREVPGTAVSLAALREARCPAGLIEHDVTVARLCREVAFLLAEAGQTVDAAVASAGGLLHDIGKGLVDTGRVRVGDPTAFGDRVPKGVTAHAWYSAAWAAQRGLDDRLVRAMLVHGLDSLLAPDYAPRTWEERVLMLCDKLVEDRAVDLTKRIAGLRRRHPSIAPLLDAGEPLLHQLEETVARAAGVGREEFRRSLTACLEVAVVPDGAEPGDVEAAIAAR